MCLPCFQEPLRVLHLAVVRVICAQVMRMPDVEWARRAFLLPETQAIPHWIEEGSEAGRLGELSVDGYYKLLDETGDAMPSHINNWCAALPENAHCSQNKTVLFSCVSL